MTILMAFYVPFISQAQATDVVTTYKDENGWKLKVNGEDFYVNGVVWGYTPRGENYSYNLWGESDEFIKKVLDYEFGLMKAAGINANRSFGFIPPRWVTYIYREHGIMSVINPLMGRYGYNVGGTWVPRTNYADELTRATLKKDMLELVNKYKDTPGVLMFAFGNESNYALEWSSFEIENLPTGEQHKEKARSLYSLWGEVIDAGKSIDKNHPFTIVNGDIQYIDLIAEYCKNMDLLGTNVYRGKGFTSLWKDVKEKLDLPVVFMEFGSDAFNARTFTEDQEAQARILKDQWQEMYNKSYGNGEEGNAIGGFVFEWRDEWWKFKIEEQEDMDIQDNNASWANGGYKFDFVEGKNNMNEEWFGITRLGPANSEGVSEAIPRMAYDVLSVIWRIDPYKYKKDAINQAFRDMNMEFLALKSDMRMLKSESKERKKMLGFTGGSLEGKFVTKGNQVDIKRDGEDGIEFTDGEMVFLDFGFQPTDRIDGQFTVNILGNVADIEPMEIEYGRRGSPVTVLEVQTVNLNGVAQDVVVPVVQEGRERVEIYDFNASYENEMYDLTTFYHVPRYHWKNKGDFFGLLRETTDMEGQDIWNAKAPFGAEFEGKKSLEGLTVLFGPEVYWGANPKVMLKYTNRFAGLDYTFLHSEDVSRTGQSASATAATTRQSRATTLYLKKELDKATFEVGGIWSASEKHGEEYTRYNNGKVIEEEIDWEDTLGIKGRVTFDLFNLANVELAATYAGLVADGGAPLEEFGITGPGFAAHSGMGNKYEYEAAFRFNFGDHMIYPRFLYRKNLVDANPSIAPVPAAGFAGVGPRNTDDDPFAVLGNREARSAELVYTYDPTGGTYFYDWNNDDKEDAGLAFNLVASYTDYPTATDSYQFFFEPTGNNAAFGVGLPQA
ncbi:MAG: hypothetical protein WBN90_07590, partial [Gammaproteobacteria bacterium]